MYSRYEFNSTRKKIISELESIMYKPESKTSLTAMEYDAIKTARNFIKQMYLSAEYEHEHQ